MGAYKTKQGYHVVTYRDEDGKGHSKSFGKGRAAKNKAETFAAEIEYKKKSGKAIPLTKRQGVYLDELLQQWINEKKAQGKNKTWLIEVANLINNNFLDELCTKPAHMLTKNDVLQIVIEKYSDHSQTTRNRYIGYLKSIFEMGVMNENLDKNPLRTWKKSFEASRNSQLTLPDLKKIQDYATEHRPHLSWAIEVLWHIPVRPGNDLFGLTFNSSVKYDRGGVLAKHNKVKKSVFIACDEPFMEALASRQLVHKSGYLIEYHGKRVSSVRKSLDYVADKIGLNYKVCLYDVRHLWITVALNRGLEPSVVAECAGTSTKMIMQNYYESHSVEKNRVAKIMGGL